MKYSIVTFGCRVNQADSLRIEEDLRARGGVAAASAEADLVVVNTCSVTASADQGARQTIRRIARDNPVGANRRDWLLRDATARRSRRRCRTSSASSGTTTRTDLGRDDGGALRGRRRRRAVRRSSPAIAGRTAFTLRVQTGCEEHCSYCIIPTTRGAGRSLPLADVSCARSSGSPAPASRKSR